MTQERKVKKEMLGQPLVIVVCRQEPVIYYCDFLLVLTTSIHTYTLIKFSNLSSTCTRTTTFSLKAIVVIAFCFVIIFFFGFCEAQFNKKDNENAGRWKRLLII